MFRFVIEQEKHLYTPDDMVVLESNALEEGLRWQKHIATTEMRRVLYQQLSPWYHSLTPTFETTSIQKELEERGYIDIDERKSLTSDSDED